MGIKKVKANTPGRREATFDDFKDVTKSTPEKRLVVIRRRRGGRNSSGKITVRHRGGGAKRYIRLVDFKRDKYDVAAVVASIEYDPNRGARLALLNYKDGAKRYIIAPVGLNVGDMIISSNQKDMEIKVGNCLLIRNIPSGTLIHNIELFKGKGG